MNQSMYSYMKVGMVSFMAYPSLMKGEDAILETLKKIAVDEFFTAIEVTWIKDRAVREQVAKLLEASKMAVAYCVNPKIGPTGLNINDTDERGRKAAVACMKEGIDEAYELGARGFAFCSAKYDEEQKEQAFAALVTSTSESCTHAKNLGEMQVVLEVFDYDVDKCCLIGPAGLARQYAQEVRAAHENFGLMVDLGHLPLLRESTEEAVQPVRDYIAHAHMGNAVCVDPSLPGYGDNHPRFGFPNGANDVEELASYLRLLLDIGFLNSEEPPICSFEVKPWGDEDPDVVVANCKRTLIEAWAHV